MILCCDGLPYDVPCDGVPYDGILGDGVCPEVARYLVPSRTALWPLYGGGAQDGPYRRGFSVLWSVGRENNKPPLLSKMQCAFY